MQNSWVPAKSPAMRTSWERTRDPQPIVYAHSSSRPTALQYRFLRSCRKFSESKRCPSSYYSEYLLGKPRNITSISQFVALGNAVTRLWGPPLDPEEVLKVSALPLISFLSPAAPPATGSPLPLTVQTMSMTFSWHLQARYSSYPVDSDTEAKQTGDQRMAQGSGVDPSTHRLLLPRAPLSWGTGLPHPTVDLHGRLLTLFGLGASQAVGI